MENKIREFAEFFFTPDGLHILLIITIFLIIIGAQVTFICQYVVKTESKINQLLMYVETDVKKDN